MGRTDEAVQAPEVPGFELGERLGGGATSEVWSAVRLADGRRVAVKVARADAEAVAAALREAEVAGRGAAEHLVGVESCLPLAGGGVALVMPLLRGGSLAGLVGARGHLSPGEVVTVLAPVASALGRLHAAGVVHGDVSPGNVLFDLDGRPALADLGLGRVVGEAPAAVWGTEGCVAPEVALGGEPSPAADVYALGALAWFCLSGVLPGAPGLREPLAASCRAGAGADRLVALVEEVVGPDAAARPGADELAWALFDVAEPAPLHLVRGDDDVSAVTYRLRAAAGDTPPPEPSRRLALRRVVGRGAQAPGRHARGRRGARVRRPRRRAGLVAGLVAVALALAGGAALAGGPRGSGAAHAGRSPAASSPEPVAGPAAASASSGTSGTSGTLTPSDVRQQSDAPRRDPTGLLEALATARARAWAEGRAALLDEAEVAGSALHRRDEPGVAALEAAGVRYRGLTYPVSRVRWVSGDAGRAVLTAHLGTSGYVPRGARAGAPVAAQGPRPVLVEVVRTARGWRLADVRAA